MNAGEPARDAWALPSGGRDATPAPDERGVQQHQAGTAFLGMVIFMASWAMLFAGLFFAYGVVRSGAHPWPPTDMPDLPLGLPATATLALALSSYGLHGALARARATGEGVARLVGAAAALGAIFLFLQARVWGSLWHLGLTPDAGPYASVFYGLTVFHALHVALGVLALGWLTVRAARRRYTPLAHIPLRLWTLYWHMVGVVWGLMYLLVYVL